MNYFIFLNTFSKKFIHSLLAISQIILMAHTQSKSETSVTAQLIDALQLKFALRIDYDTEVEPQFENTNTETSMTLIYNF